MKVCTETHFAPSFGEIPAGSLWADDSPYLVDESKFAPVEEAPAAPVKRKPVRKFGQPAVEVEVSDDD